MCCHAIPVGCRRPVARATLSQALSHVSQADFKPGESTPRNALCAQREHGAVRIELSAYIEVIYSTHLVLTSGVLNPYWCRRNPASPPPPRQLAKPATPRPQCVSSNPQSDVIAWLLAAPPGTLVLASEVLARLTITHAGPQLVADAPTGRSQTLTATDAAQRLGMSVVWLYRNAPRLPFTIRVGKRSLRFDAGKLERWKQNRVATVVGSRAAQRAS